MAGGLLAAWNGSAGLSLPARARARPRPRRRACALRTTRRSRLGSEGGRLCRHRSLSRPARLACAIATQRVCESQHLAPPSAGVCCLRYCIASLRPHTPSRVSKGVAKGARFVPRCARSDRRSRTTLRSRRQAAREVPARGAARAEAGAACPSAAAQRSRGFQWRYRVLAKRGPLSASQRRTTPHVSVTAPRRRRRRRRSRAPA